MSEENTATSDTNPYQTPKTAADEAPVEKHNTTSTARCALTGAFWSVLSAFPVAGLMALVFRFPVPFAGYRSGFDAIVPAMVAVVFYGVFTGGFILVAGLGALGGVITASFAQPKNQRRWSRLWAIAVTTACLSGLAVLDKIIGPW